MNKIGNKNKYMVFFKNHSYFVLHDHIQYYLLDKKKRILAAPILLQSLDGAVLFLETLLKSAKDCREAEWILFVNLWLATI